MREEELNALYERRYAGGYMLEHGPVAERRVREVLSCIKEPPRRVLDYGCGRGAWIPTLTSAFPSAEIVGLETSPTALAHAERNYPDLRFLLFDGRRAPFEDESFDLVFSYHVLEHVLDLTTTVGDIARLVRVGGHLVMCLPCGNPGSFEERIVRSVPGGIERSTTGEPRFFYEDETHLRRVTTAALDEVFRRERCVVNDAFFSGHFWGAVQYFAGNVSATRDLVDPQRAPGRRTKLTLIAWRAAFAVLNPAVRINRIALRPRIAETRGVRRLALATAGAAKPVAGLIVRTLDQLAEREWQTKKHDRSGSAQFLILAKELQPERSTARHLGDDLVN